MLPDHVEHWGGGSINIHHWGANKIWSLKAPRQYLPTIQKMQALQEHGNLRGYIGVCQSTLTHRDVWFDAVFLGCDNYQVVQEPGDIMVIAPYAIHNVQNLGTNCAASKNVCHLNYFLNVLLTKFVNIPRGVEENQCSTKCLP